MRLKVVAALFAILCFSSLFAGCMELPEYDESGTGTDIPLVSTPKSTPTTPPTPSYVMNQTPYLTPTPVQTVPSTYRNISFEPPSPESLYTEIYNESLDMKYNVVAFSYDLTQPPMVIKYAILPVNRTYERYVREQYLSRAWITENVDTYDPNGWAEIKVIDRDTGEVVKAEGYRKQYLENLKGTINVNTIGDYQVEIRGNLVTVDVSILVGGLNENG